MSASLIQIPQELFVVAESSHFEGTFTQTELDVGPDTFIFEGPVSWSVVITNTGDALLMTGTSHATVTCACARCLEDVTFELSGEVEGYFLLSPEGEDPTDWDEDEFDVLPESKEIDIAPYALAALLIEIPLVPLCSEDCLGLCYACGANLNETTCSCKSEESDDQSGNPFAVLRELIEEGEKE